MSGVRPTKRCIDDLGLSFPLISVPLETLEHDLVAKAQALPEEQAAGGLERVLSLTDRTWYKVKIGEYRGAGGEVAPASGDLPQMWWLVAGGIRRSDTAAQDFYSQIEAESVRSAKKLKNSPASVNTDHLLPQATDVRRWELEQAALGAEALKQAVREAICRSAHRTQPVSATSATQQIIAWVKSQDGDTYLAIAAEGFLDPNEIAIILDAVPGVGQDDWQTEPGEILGISPAYGQIVFSTIIPPESLSAILEQSPVGYL